MTKNIHHASSPHTCQVKSAKLSPFIFVNYFALLKKGGRRYARRHSHTHTRKLAHPPSQNHDIDSRRRAFLHVSSSRRHIKLLSTLPRTAEKTCRIDRLGADLVSIYAEAPLMKNHLSMEASILPGATSSLGGRGGSCSGATRLVEWATVRLVLQNELA